MGAFSFAQTNHAHQNEDRSRWYGIRPGDLVEERAFGQVRSGEVMYLHGTDNNGCTIRIKTRRGSQDVKAVCEWLTIIEKVEDRKK